MKMHRWGVVMVLAFLACPASSSRLQGADRKGSVTPQGDPRGHEYPGKKWKRASPDSVGMNARKLHQARDYALTGGGSGYITRHGKLVLAWGDPRRRYDLKSTTKSIGVTALGLALADGKMKLDERARKYHPTLGTPPRANEKTGWLKDITIQHLATHTAGFEKPGGFQKLVFAPGSKWLYSDGGPNWLAECVTLVYRKDAKDLLFDRVFTPMGITSKDLTWRNNAYRPRTIEGIPRREFGSGIHANVDAMARIGYLYLRGGKWKKKRLLPASFVDRVRQPIKGVVGLPEHNKQHGNASDHYGLLWWNNADGSLKGVPRSTYWSWGLHDSLIVVFPDLDIVVARAGKSWKREGGSHYRVLGPFLQPIASSVTNEKSSKKTLEPPTLKTAITRSLALLQKSTIEYRKHRTCFSCHHQALPVLALAEARKRGFGIDEKNFQIQVQHTHDHLKRGRTRYLKGRGQGGRADTAGYALWTLEAGGRKPDQTTAAVTDFLIGWSRKKIYWQRSGRRPPSEASNFTTTYLALRALGTFGTRAQAKDRAVRVSKAKEWLIKTTPGDTEDRVFRLRALSYLGVKDEVIQQAQQELLKTQHQDGGWSQLPDGKSDAYATGTVLVALQGGLRGANGGKTSSPVKCARRSSSLGQACPEGRSARSPLERGRREGRASTIGQGPKRRVDGRPPPLSPRSGGGLTATDPAYQRGVRFLLRTQQEDGSWHVRSRSKPFQLYFESGFPHGKDQFISITASSWATLALLLTYPEVKKTR